MPDGLCQLGEHCDGMEEASSMLACRMQSQCCMHVPYLAMGSGMVQCCPGVCATLNRVTALVCPLLCDQLLDNGRLAWTCSNVQRAES